MSTWHWLPVAFAAFMLSSASREANAQPLAVNPSAAASDVRNPSSTNPSAAASDIRNPSATNPSAAASQIPQPAPGIAPRRTNSAPRLSTSALECRRSVRARHRWPNVESSRVGMGMSK